MGALRLALSGLTVVAASPAAADPTDKWRPLIEEASLRFVVPSAWIERVMRAESAGETTLNGRAIRSSAGAMGLMQLMPATWADMRARLRLGQNPDDPRDNILAGTLYLRLLYDRFGYPGLFGAYNCGPACYAAYLAGRRHLPGETVAYLAKVSGASRGLETSRPAAAILASAAPRPPLFVVRREVVELASDAPAPRLPPALFAIRRPER